MRCDSCNKKLIKVDRRTELAELDEDATDGQMADYFAAAITSHLGGSIFRMLLRLEHVFTNEIGSD